MKFSKIICTCMIICTSLLQIQGFIQIKPKLQSIIATRAAYNTFIEKLSTNIIDDTINQVTLDHIFNLYYPISYMSHEFTNLLLTFSILLPLLPLFSLYLSRPNNEKIENTEIYRTTKKQTSSFILIILLLFTKNIEACV